MVAVEVEEAAVTAVAVVQTVSVVQTVAVEELMDVVAVVAAVVRVIVATVPYTRHTSAIRTTPIIALRFTRSLLQGMPQMQQ